jgi:tRNA A58 N-methylase Trm61
MASYITLVLALGAAVLGSSVGTSGVIRHTEIRDNNVNTAVENVKSNTESATDGLKNIFLTKKQH